MIVQDAQNILRLHEMTQEQDPDEAGLMKQRSRIEQARKLKAAPATEIDVERGKA